MLGITDLTTYLIGTVAIVLLPGPNSLYVLSVAAGRGVRSGYAAACGVFAGDSILMFLAASGAAALMRTHPVLFSVLKYLGAAYLAWVAYNLFRGALKKWRSSGTQLVPKATDASHPFKKAIVLSLLNPKAILFFMSFFIQFVDPGYAYPALSFLTLALILQLCSFLYLSMLMIAGSRIADAFRRRRRLSAALTGGVGALFLSFSLKLATATL